MREDAVVAAMGYGENLIATFRAMGRLTDEEAAEALRRLKELPYCSICDTRHAGYAGEDCKG